jgi:adenylate cyclase class IV
MEIDKEEQEDVHFQSSDQVLQQKDESLQV